MDRHFDIAIAGGGLAGGLIALALAARRPELSVGIVEAGEKPGGNHIWSFFASDVAEADRTLIEPLVATAWADGYDVAFPGHRRHLRTPYRSLRSEDLAAALARALPADALLTGAEVAALDPGGVTLSCGARIAARGVIDARGLTPGDPALAALSGGWQKFAGQMLELEEPHGLRRPVVMDATVAQHDGYRFVYCLPFSATQIFVEDTYYSDEPMLDRALLAGRIEAYAAERGWRIARCSRDEAGVLPVVAGGDFDSFWAAGDAGIGRAGVRAALFHPLTSFSLPDAVRFAAHIAALPRLDSASLAAASRSYARRHWRRARFYRMLAKMLFAAAAPERRYRLLERFYRLDERLIERFYAGQSTHGDRLRLLSGRPPVAITRAALVLAGLAAGPPRLRRA